MRPRRRPPFSNRHQALLTVAAAVFGCGMLGGAELTALAMLVVAAVWTVVYQVGPGGGYYATIVYLGDDSTRALLTAVGNTVRARAARHRHAAPRRVAPGPRPALGGTAAGKSPPPSPYAPAPRR